MLFTNQLKPIGHKTIRKTVPSQYEQFIHVLFFPLVTLVEKRFPFVALARKLVSGLMLRYFFGLLWLRPAKSTLSTAKIRLKLLTQNSS